ncbi:TIGR01777 family oxidoreductase [Paenibacillus sp. J2TS4]|uniref:TIGR01777 family oxidoreductase n=1 Tax=Paenibacillus sp. J2TS4 TaxID=2807194 RepID=UPI001B092C5F|nr:TIGR01777 family oxidoreductase [Paenibacillus sp. J2TS4]GIP32722.1 epimerase [Paenibacillus sp. J2TS4]
MKIAITGGTGFIGKHLIRYLADQGDEIIVISRSSSSNVPGAEVLSWGELEAVPGRLEGVDAIVNLAGETINQRWSPAAKERILQSRLDAAAAIARAVASMERKPEVVVNGSGMSIYGISDEETFDERSPARLTDFLAGVVDRWEQAAEEIQDTRLVKLRVGLVLGADGGAFPRMKLPYKLGVGGRLGSGKQWMSWIHIEDMVRLIDFCIRHRQVTGPINATAPHPVMNDEFGRTLGRVMGRGHYFPVPSIVFKLLFGELSILLLEGQKVLPSKALQYGFDYRSPELQPALANLTASR